MAAQGAVRWGRWSAELSGLPRARARLVEGFTRWEAYLAQGFAAMVDRGELVADADPSDLATATMTAVQGGLLLSDAARSVRPLELALDMALDHIAAQVR